MKIVAINGSPRKNGNTAQCLETVRREVEAAGVEFEVFQPGAKVHPCMACYHCLNTGSLRCVRRRHGQRYSLAAGTKPTHSAGLPVYHCGIAGGMNRADRLMLAAGCGSISLHHKVGGALCTLRRSAHGAISSSGTMEPWSGAGNVRLLGRGPRRGGWRVLPTEGHGRRRRLGRTWPGW